MTAHAVATHVTTNGTLQGFGQRNRVSPALASWLKDIAANLTDWWAWRRSYKQTLHELQGLSTKELDDIGISRADIMAIAMQSANQCHTAR